MDIKNLIMGQLPNGIIDSLEEKTGVDKNTIDKIIDAGLPEVVDHGLKTEGGLFDNIAEDIVTKKIKEKTGLDEGTISKVLSFVIPFVKEHIDGNEMKKIIGGLSNGIGMDDLENVAGAILNNGSSKENSKSGGFLGNILGGLFGGKK